MVIPTSSLRGGILNLAASSIASPRGMRFKRPRSQLEDGTTTLKPSCFSDDSIRCSMGMSAYPLAAGVNAAFARNFRAVPTPDIEAHARRFLIRHLLVSL